MPDRTPLQLLFVKEEVWDSRCDESSPAVIGVIEGDDLSEAIHQAAVLHNNSVKLLYRETDATPRIFLVSRELTNSELYLEEIKKVAAGIEAEKKRLAAEREEQDRQAKRKKQMSELRIRLKTLSTFSVQDEIDRITRELQRLEEEG